MERRLSAILSSDVVAYSRAMGIDEARTLETLKSHRREVIDPKTAQYGGRTIKLMGDGALMEFASVVDAVAFAVDVQYAIAKYNAELPEDHRLIYRVGVNLGDIIVEGDDIYGDGVNIAARLQALAEPGGICIARSVHTQVHGKLDLTYQDLGPQTVKNISVPVPAYSVALDARAEALATPVEAASIAPVSRLLQHAAALAVVLVALIGLLVWQPWVPDFEPVDVAAMVHSLPAKPSIAVLAFDDLSAGEDQGYLSDAIAEGIITKLSHFPELFVIARNSSFFYKGKATDVRDVSRELGVRYVLEGSRQKFGNSLRVTVQLIDAVAGNHIWAKTFDLELNDIFKVQDQISDTVASTLGEKLPKIAGEEAKRAVPAQLRAFERVLNGDRHFREFTKEGTEEARLSLLAAIELDPGMAKAHAGLAWVHINGYRWGWTDLKRDEALDEARVEAQIGLELAPDDYFTQFTMASVHMQAGAREQAISEFEKSLDLNPNAGNVMAAFAEFLGYAGKFREAIDLLQVSMRLDPHHPAWFHWNLGWAQYSVGDCEAALETMRRMSSMPYFANRTLSAIFVCLGQLDNARAAIAALLENDPDYSIAKFRLNIRDKYEDPGDLEHWIDDLRTAGLPEGAND